jgi:hypothetical protein
MTIVDFRKAVPSPRLVLAMAAALTLTLALAACSGIQQVALLDDQKCQAEGLEVGSKKYDRCRAALEGERKLEISGVKQP